jgi:hypothetical protein
MFQIHDVTNGKDENFDACTAAVVVASTDSAEAKQWLDQVEVTGGDVYVLECSRKTFFAGDDDVTIDDMIRTLDNAGIDFEVVPHIPRPEVKRQDSDTVVVHQFSGPPFADSYFQVTITVPIEGDVKYKTIETVHGRHINTRRHSTNAFSACLTVCNHDVGRAKKMVRWLESATRWAIKQADELLAAE